MEIDILKCHTALLFLQFDFHLGTAFKLLESQSASPKRLKGIDGYITSVIEKKRREK